MDRLVQTHLGVMKNEVVDTAWNDAKGCAPYEVFLYFERCSQSLFRQGVTLDFANSHKSADTRLVHTYVVTKGLILMFNREEKSNKTWIQCGDYYVIINGIYHDFESVPKGVWHT